MTTNESTRFDLRSIDLADLMALDLRREAAAIHGCTDLDDRESIADALEGVSTAAPFFPHPALAYRLTTGGPASDVLVAVDAGRIGIASNGDAVWGDLAVPVDITTVDGGDAFAAAVEAAIRDYLDHAEAWEARA